MVSKKEFEELDGDELVLENEGLIDVFGWTGGSIDLVVVLGGKALALALVDVLGRTSGSVFAFLAGSISVSFLFLSTPIFASVCGTC